MTTREYVGAGITVHWDSDRCIHSERCTMGAPSVFDRSARPWVNLEGASADEVARVVDTCPSGALTYSRTDGAPNGRRGRAWDEDPAASLQPDTDAADAQAAPVDPSAASVAIITPQVNGPLVVQGPVGITQADGTVKVARRLVLCRCGNSESKPMCDGSHARVGFVADGAPPRRVAE